MAMAAAETEPKFKGKQQAGMIFGYLSGFEVLFPFPETRTIKAREQAGRQRRQRRQSHL